MLGNLLAGTEESPGETILYERAHVQGLPGHGILHAFLEVPVAAAARHSR